MDNMDRCRVRWLPGPEPRVVHQVGAAKFHGGEFSQVMVIVYMETNGFCFQKYLPIFIAL